MPTFAWRRAMTSVRTASFQAARSFALALALAPAAASAQDLAAGDPQMKFSIENVATGVTQPTDVQVLADGRAVILQKNGDVVVRNKDGTNKRNTSSALRWGNVDASSE